MLPFLALDVRGGLLQSMMMLFTFMGAPGLNIAAASHLISSCAEVFGGYSSVAWLNAGGYVGCESPLRIFIMDISDTSS